MSACFSNSHISSCLLCFFVVFSLFRLCFPNQNLDDDVLCMDAERQALVEFKHGLIDEADRLASWVSEESNCCKWVGIACDNITGHVHHIHLPGLDGHCDYGFSKQRLRGNLGSSLLHLKQLKHLDLSCNYFEGIQVPKFIGSLRNLRYLNLSNSGFGGIIPPQLGNLSELQVLCLASNLDFGFESTRMMNMQWLSSLSKLHHLDLSGVDLSKATDWLQVINSLSSLVQLYLSSCELSNLHPHVPSLNNITSLSLLDLSENPFSNSYVPKWIFSITSLVSLDLTWCKFHVTIPTSIYSFRNLTSLKLLHVSGNDFMNSSLVLQELSSSNLVSLDVSYCSVSSSVLVSLHNLTSLLSLDLSQNQLNNRIPKSLGNLCNLRESDLSKNNFGNISLTYILESFFECKSPALESLSIFSSELSGYLPYQLEHLTHLEYLQLYNNSIAGIIPDSIGRLSFLKMLHLGSNQISGPIPYSIGQLSMLEELVLSYNRLDGNLPDSLGQLSKLKQLAFPYNLLSGVVTEAHFAKLVSLKYLHGSGNILTLRPQLEDWIPPFQLKYLYLNSWDLGPQIPLWLQSQRDLRQLAISNTHISSPMLPESFWKSHPNLTHLDMSKNHIKGKLTFFSIPATLQELDLSSNEFRGKLPYLSNGLFPKILDLSNNSFVGSLNHWLCSNGVKETKYLNIGNNYLSGVIPKCWEKWPSLELLNLENNNLYGKIPRTLGFLSSLQLLNMRGNKISGRLPVSLLNISYLEVLQLGRNELVGRIPTWFGTNLTFLRILNLRSNNFDGNIPQELCYLTRIQILDLAQNNLSGNIPRCFNNFSVLSGKETISNVQFYFELDYAGSAIASDSLVMKGREDTYRSFLGLVMLLDLSSNNFNGIILSELTALRELKSLNLSGNQLRGRIPEKIGDLKELVSFDLSVNKLSGELPISLSSLNFLSSFNVSYNNLIGRIPVSTQLQSFNESSFVGNKLCGAPLTQSCAVMVPDTEDNSQKEGDGADWGLIISIVLGFIVGFWIIVAPLMVSKAWRITYFHFLSEMRYKFF